MENFNFTSWATYKDQTQPSEGFNVSGDYIAPTSETEVRNQLQSLHSQTKNKINEMITDFNSLSGRVGSAESDIDSLQANEITNITGDSSIDVIKTGSTYQLSVVETGEGVRREYVDDQVQGAKDYTDSKLAITTDVLAAGGTSITLYDERITTDSILSFYTSVYGVTVSVSTGSVTLTFNAQAAAMTVGVSVDG